MEDLTLLVKNDKHGETETSGIVQPLHQGFALCHFLLALRLARIVIHMYILKIGRYDIADCGVLHYKVCKLQTPGTPVATHLTDDVLPFGLGFRHSLIYLFNGVDVLVIHLFHSSLSV